MSEKKERKITGHEGEPGSFIADADGKRHPNKDADPVTLNPDDQGYHEAKKRLAAAAPAKDQPAPAPSPAAAPNIGGK